MRPTGWVEPPELPLYQPILSNAGSLPEVLVIGPE